MNIGQQGSFRNVDELILFLFIEVQYNTILFNTRCIDHQYYCQVLQIALCSGQMLFMVSVFNSSPSGSSDYSWPWKTPRFIKVKRTVCSLCIVLFMALLTRDLCSAMMGFGMVSVRWFSIACTVTIFSFCDASWIDTLQQGWFGVFGSLLINEKKMSQIRVETASRVL